MDQENGMQLSRLPTAFTCEIKWLFFQWKSIRINPVLLLFKNCVLRCYCRFLVDQTLPLCTAIQFSSLTIITTSLLQKWLWQIIAHFSKLIKRLETISDNFWQFQVYFPLVAHKVRTEHSTGESNEFHGIFIYELLQLVPYERWAMLLFYGGLVYSHQNYIWIWISTLQIIDSRVSLLEMHTARCVIFQIVLRLW